MSSYNPYYTYPDLYLWQNEAYEGCTNEAAPLFHYLAGLIKEEKKKDYYPDREDLVTDTVNRVPYFPDVVKAWRKKGMVFSCSGMMGEVMAPTAIQSHEVREAPVLYIPYISDREDRKEAMNLLEANRNALEAAAKENVLVQFAECGECTHGAVLEKMIESQGTYRITYYPVYLDISLLEKRGKTLADVPGLNPDNWVVPVRICGRLAVNVSDKLELKQAHQHSISNIYQCNQPRWNFDRHIRSLAAKRQAESMRLEYFCKTTQDQLIQDFLAERGLIFEEHPLERESYMTITPRFALERPEDKLPVFLIMKEFRSACDTAGLTAFQFYYDFIELCARGQFMIVFFALETPEDNDEVIPGILEDVFDRFPADRTRVYLTGQSHNGYYALEFYRRHPNLIAATATLCDPAGLQVGAVIDYYKTQAEEIVASFREHDYPLIDINGNLENRYANPERTEAQAEEDVFYFQNRMRAWRMREFTRDEILNAPNAADYATRMNGVPADRSEVRYLMGDEVYVSDYQNENGRWLYRYISIENTPHMIMPQMAELSWEFVRRFARNPETGESVELY